MRLMYSREVYRLTGGRMLDCSAGRVRSGGIPALNDDVDGREDTNRGGVRGRGLDRDSRSRTRWRLKAPDSSTQFNI